MNNVDISILDDMEKMVYEKLGRWKMLADRELALE